MGPNVIHYYVNTIGSEFKLDLQKLNEIVQPGHKGLTVCVCITHIDSMHNPH